MEVFLTSFATWSQDLGRIESHLFTSLISNLENSIKVSKLFITLRTFFSIVNIPCKFKVLFIHRHGKKRLVYRLAAVNVSVKLFFIKQAICFLSVSTNFFWCLCVTEENLIP